MQSVVGLSKYLEILHSSWEIVVHTQCASHCMCDIPARTLPVSFPESHLLSEEEGKGLAQLCTSEL